MRMAGVKLRWAKKLLGAKYFVVMTDSESIVALAGVNPEAFTDYIALTAQAAEIQSFYEALGDLVKRHKKAVDELMGGDPVTTNRKDTPKKNAKTKANAG